MGGEAVVSQEPAAVEKPILVFEKFLKYLKQFFICIF